MEPMQLWVESELQHLKVGFVLVPPLSIHSIPTNQVSRPVLTMGAMDKSPHAWINQFLSSLNDLCIRADEGIRDVADDVLVPFGLNTHHVGGDPCYPCTAIAVLGLEVELNGARDPKTSQVLPIENVLGLP